ncbi:MAG: M3 family oligoendopeptidase [Aliidongia sp.]
MTAMPSTAPGDALGALPKWNLADLYDGPQSSVLAADLQQAQALAAAFRSRHESRVAALTGPDFAAAIAEYEQIHEILGRIGSYAALLHAGDMSDALIGGFYQTTQERLTAIGAATLFFTLEINRIPDEALHAQCTTPDLARWQPWLRDLRAFRPYQLPDELEQLLYEKSVTGHAAWSRLFDETMADLRFPIGGRDLTSAEAFDLMSNPDRATRRAAAEAITAGLRGAGRILGLIHNTLAKDKEIEDRKRGFAQPISSRNLENHVEDAVVDALIGAAKAAYPVLSHRYYRLKAKWLGLEKLEYWDRNAPLPGTDDRIIPWPDAQGIVLDSYRQFSPRMAEIGERFFAKNWIDAPVRPGKTPGAFSHPVVPSAHPYLLMNYLGRTRDVMVLAHELGHGVHQVLAGGQGLLQAQTPLTLAETASVFGEMLTFRNLLARETDPVQRRSLLAGKVEDMLGTAVRQIAFCDFERRFHAERRLGEVTAERMGEIWMAIQHESLGDAFTFDPGYASWWSSVPHFIHSPFYVYAYAFGDCLVNSLYAVYQHSEAGFAERYLAMLSAGGTLRHRELLAPFGLDAADPGFWARGLGVIGGFIDELEAIEA